MNQQKIFIVSGSFSSWDDYHTRIFKAFYNKEDAEKYAEKADRILKAMANHIAEANYKTNIEFENEDDMTIEEMSKAMDDYEQTDTFKKALAIWSAHQNLDEFNQCHIEEITIL